VFDPALKQFPHAYRAGEPVFDDEQLGEHWRRTRRIALEQVLRAVAGSPWAGHLVVRGIMLLRAWPSQAAREPGDLDFVVTPPTMMLDDAGTWRMFDGITAAALEHPGPVRFASDEVAVADIWTYERAPGRRIVFTWHADTLPPGTVQLDLVFNEQLPEPPTTVSVPTSDGSPPILVRAASPQLSLAWKILWLETDMYPQGKDLYDATLLAEYTTVPLGLLRRTLAREFGGASEPVRAPAGTGLGGGLGQSGVRASLDRRRRAVLATTPGRRAGTHLRHRTALNQPGRLTRDSVPSAEPNRTGKSIGRSGCTCTHICRRPGVDRAGSRAWLVPRANSVAVPERGR